MSNICMRKLVTEELMSACVKVAGAEGQDINSLLGDDTVTNNEEEFKAVVDAMEEESASIKQILQAVLGHFKDFFKKLDDEGNGTVQIEAFKVVLSDLESEYSMPFMTEGAEAAIQAAQKGDGKIDYVKFLNAELLTPREEEKL